jgi:hypothetical protein
MTQDISNSTRQKKSDAIFCSSRPATYKASVTTTIGDMVLRRIQDETGLHKLIRDGRDPSSFTRLHN